MLENFYPTPKDLIYKMLNGVKLDHISTILEPSAGKGDIADMVADKPVDSYYRNVERRTVDVIEINPDMQHILRGKGYNLIQDDFLTFETSKCYDLIIANFPFSDGDKHLAHALRLLDKNGGQLVCLVNAETVLNPRTRLRQSVNSRLTELGASIEFLQNEFLTAERRTNVEVALIRASVKIERTSSFILSDLQAAKEREAADRPFTDVVERDFRKLLVARFNLECEAGAGLIDEYFALKPHILNQLPKRGETDYSSPLIELKVKDCSSRESRGNLVNSYLSGVRYKYWQTLINDPRYTGQYTTNIQQDLQRKLEQLRNCDFNIFNIEQLAKDLQSQVTAGVEKAILDLFDKFSVNHKWDESIHEKNVHYYTGWKTNKSWKINKRVIIPMNGISADYSSKYKFDYRVHEDLQDMVKVFNYLSPEKTDVCRLVASATAHAETMQDFGHVDFRYFEAKFFKKRTCHIKFTDMDLLDKFNIFGSQRKGWLPPSYGKAAYEDMSVDDQYTVETFQGKERYEQVMKNADYFIVDDAAGLLGTGE